MSLYGIVVVVVVVVIGSDTCEADKQQKLHVVQLSPQGPRWPPFILMELLTQRIR